MSLASDNVTLTPSEAVRTWLGYFPGTAYDRMARALKGGWVTIIEPWVTEAMA
jgi:hypothetical protein